MAQQDTRQRATDLELVRRCQHGDTAAFSEIVMRYQDRLYNTVYRLIGSAEDAGDVVQDSLIQAYGAIGDFRRQSSLSTWLFRITVNSAMSYRRRHMRMRLVRTLDDPDDLESSPWLQNQADPNAPAPLEEAEAHEVRGRVREAIEGLDDQHRAVVVLRDMEQCDYSEIATILDVPVGTVKSRLHRARLMLRRRLGPIINIR
ncbi:MAG: sigma-70 family RNA polymerase sigma factor [Planctomycetia bacterium]|nr:sigma-70 family RNA polymerase sigma factor [Planctomycetia bacterium]